jgi:hypothetical protein
LIIMMTTSLNKVLIHKEITCSNNSNKHVWLLPCIVLRNK